jgi:hypothetical protein
LEEKYKNISDEYAKDKNDFKETVNKYNDMLIESKLKLKTLEEKIKNFENEKKMLKEANERSVIENNKAFEDKINNLNMDINKLKSEIKTKDEDMLMEKLNLEQMSALNTQKITFLENEVKTWKERYDEQSKDLSEIKSEKNSLSTDMDKLKAENKNLKNKLNSLNPGDVSNLEKKMNSTINTTSNGFYAGMNRASNKLLIELLTEQNSIKDFLAEIKNNTNKIISMNQNIMSNVQILNKGKNIQNNLEEIDNKKEILNNIENSNGNDVEEFKIIENNGCNDDKNMSNEFFKTIDNTEKEEKKEKEIDINNIDNIESLKIKIINHVLKKIIQVYLIWIMYVK